MYGCVLVFFFSIGKGLKDLYSSPQVQSYLNGVPPHELFKEKQIYQCGELRKVFIYANICDIYYK